MSHLEIIAKLKLELLDRSNDDLEIIKADGDGSPSPDAVNRRIAATQILNERLLSEIKRHHWSVTPGFLVGVVAMVAACIAAYGVLFPQPPAQSPAAVVVPSTQTVQPALDSSSNSHTLSVQASPPPPKSTKK